MLREWRTIAMLRWLFNTDQKPEDVSDESERVEYGIGAGYLVDEMCSL